jgi:NTE family protein
MMAGLMNGGGKHLALVVGSGAVKCAAALGLWKVLQREGIKVDMYVGCSGGSLYTATMALGLDLEECIEKTKRLWTREVTEKRHWPSLLRAALPGVFKFDERFGMVDDHVLVERLHQAFGDSTFDELKAPLYIVATDFFSGEEVVLEQGRLLDAIRASISIPYIWPAWQVGSRLLVDGSLSNPMPVDVAIREGAEIILAMGFESPSPSRVRSISRFAFHVNSIMTNNLYRANFAFHNLAHHAEIIPILPEFDQPVRLFDTQKIPYVISRGEQAAEEQIPYLQQLLSMPTP